jgi:hypothetical protein
VTATRPYQFKLTGNRIHSHCLFRYISCGIVLLYIILSGENFIVAQVRVTGHVFAEIVEPAALSSKAYNSHLIELNSHTSNNEMLLAQVKLSGGRNMNVDVAVITSHLVSADGEILPFDVVCPICFEDGSNSLTGEKLFTLKATPGESILPERSNTYIGRYSLVFMYN